MDQKDKNKINKNTKKLQYKAGDLVIVYKETPTFQDGAIGQIIDRDPFDFSYAVAEIKDVIKEDGDIIKLLNNYVKWVKEEDLEIIKFDKPKSILTKIKDFFRRLF